MGNYCYSWNGEDYSNGLYETEKEAIEAAKSDMPDADEVYIGQAFYPELRWCSNEENIFESMQDNLNEDCGEYAECGLDSVTPEQEVELGKMIDETVKKWIERFGIKPSCYTVIDSGLAKLN